MLPSLFFLCVLFVGGTVGGEPNPPVWPASVSVFSPGNDEETQKVVNAAYDKNGGGNNNGQFSDLRFAFLFLPGVYEVEVPLGYYTTVAGLGTFPENVTFTSPKGVYSEESSLDPGAGALCTFWRSAENFLTLANYSWPGPIQNGSCALFDQALCSGDDLTNVSCPNVTTCCELCSATAGCSAFTQDIHDEHGQINPTCWMKTGCANFQEPFVNVTSGIIGTPFPGGQGMMWAVSQASPLRRVRIAGDLLLSEYTTGTHAGYSSGGFMANVEVKGTVQAGTQQQWMTRNCDLGGWENGTWNMVFVGTRGAPDDHCGGVYDHQPATTTVDTAPLTIEKPFITVTENPNKANDYLFFLQVPQQQTNTRGTDFSLNDVTSINFNQVFVADASMDVSLINSKLAAGLHVVLCPGIYNLKTPLNIVADNQVLYGLGMATLVSANGNAVIQVNSNLSGVRIAGLLLQAGPDKTHVLLQWGTSISAGSSDNPNAIHDVYARVGGPDTHPVQADVMVAINTGNMVLDHLWLWRADHTVTTWGVKNGDNPCKNGLVVNGSDVTAYGLFVEHQVQDLTVWNGERGRVFLYQSELPYDLNQSWADRFVGYRVGSNVKEHEAFGVGVYHFFRDYVATAYTAIVAPTSLEKNFHHSLALYLSGRGTLQHILNSQGSATNASSPIADPEIGHGGWVC